MWSEGILISISVAVHWVFILGCYNVWLRIAVGDDCGET
jgi:hypothetical protein